MPAKWIKTMNKRNYKRLTDSTIGWAIALVSIGTPVQAQPSIQYLPNMGQQITPLAPQNSRFEPLNPGGGAVPDNPAWLAGQAVTSVVSPDKSTLLILTSGFNRFYTADNATPPWSVADSNEYVFIYDISMRTPLKKQVVAVPNTYHGIVFDPSGKAFYVAGAADDSLHIYVLNSKAVWAEAASSPVALNHINPVFGVRLGVGLNIVPNDSLAINSSVGVGPCAAGVAISKDGLIMVVTNYYNDSISVLTGGLGKWSLAVSNFDLRPGKIAPNDPSQVGKPGGEYPFWAAVTGDGTTAKPYTAYVSSIRDREVDVVDLSGAPTLTTRISVKGQPNKMTLNAAQTLLFVAADQSDTVEIINIDPTSGNIKKNTIVESIPVIAPMLPDSLAQYKDRNKGANPNSVALSPDETQLYVTDGNLNCISVISLSGVNSGNYGVDKVIGLIPTGWYPNSASLVSFPAPNPAVYAFVVNAKSPTGGNPGWCYGGYGPANSPNCFVTNSYNPQLTKAGFQSFPIPGTSQLATLTAQVATNNRFSYTVSESDATVMATVRKAIKHVVFIIRENRTYDQILGDLEVGNGDPDLAMFGASVTPNAHQLARQFVTLDNFMDTAEVSYDGWLWTTAAQAPDVVQHQYPVTYAYRALSLDADGDLRNVNVAIPALADRIKANPFTANDPDVLPGQVNTAAPDGPDNEVNTGYLWSAAMRAGLTVRNYGFFIDCTLYSTTAHAIPVLRYPASTGTPVAVPSNAELAPFTDPYFRGFDNSLPDYYRYQEWAREFDQLPARRQGDVVLRSPAAFPSLSLVRFMHDHTGNWTSPPLDGVNTPELMVADNDYAVGLLIQKVARSEYANSTLIFVVEDDAQDGGDHVDSHRSVAFVVGPYVKQGAVVSTPYNTLNFLRTIEEVLGLPPMNLNDALARPMADIFDTTSPTPRPWTFTATPAPRLFSTGLPLFPRPAGLNVPKSTHNAKYWAHATKGMDFSREDNVDSKQYNLILWKGIMGDKPYPLVPSGLDLRQNRAALLPGYRQSQKTPAQERTTGTN